MSDTDGGGDVLCCAVLSVCRRLSKVRFGREAGSWIAQSSYKATLVERYIECVQPHASIKLVFDSGDPQIWTATRAPHAATVDLRWRYAKAHGTNEMKLSKHNDMQQALCGYIGAQKSLFGRSGHMLPKWRTK